MRISSAYKSGSGWLEMRSRLTGSVNATHRQQRRQQTEVGMVGDKRDATVWGRPGVTSVRVSVRFWLCFDWQATCTARCGGMHVRPQASFLNRLPCVFSLCILETIDRKHHVRFRYVADVCRLWDSSYSFSFRLIWSSFNLTKTPASPPLTRWTNSPSFAPKMTLKSDGKSV